MSRGGRPRLQPLARGKVAALGPAGAAWAEALPATLDDLARRWGLELGRGLPGGSASYVCAATSADGEPRVVKVRMPDAGGADEAALLDLAAGRGYVRLHAREDDVGALLLERLGPSLETAGAYASVPERLDVVLDVLARAWAALPEPSADDEGAGRAAELAVLVERWAAAHPDAADPRVVREALRCARARDAARAAGAEVTCHGDPHPGNVMRVLAARPGAEAGCVLIDPDGVRAEAAYDVGVLLRGWTTALAEAPDPARELSGWCRRASARAGLDPDAVWQWAYLERVSTGLYLATLGSHRLAGAYLGSAAALLGGLRPAGS